MYVHIFYIHITRYVLSEVKKRNWGRRGEKLIRLHNQKCLCVYVWVNCTATDLLKAKEFYGRGRLLFHLCMCVFMKKHKNKSKIGFLEFSILQIMYIIKFSWKKQFITKFYLFFFFFSSSPFTYTHIHIHKLYCFMPTSHTYNVHVYVCNVLVYIEVYW